jgi:hypothetical protein
MSLKGFFQFIIIVLLFGGGYAIFIKANTQPEPSKEVVLVKNDAPYSSDVDFAKKALSDVKSDLEDAKISEREANDRFQNIIQNLLRSRGIDPNKTDEQLTEVEKAKIMRIMTAVDPKSIYSRYGVFDTQAMLEQNQEEIESAEKHMKKVSLTTKILAFFAPKDSKFAKEAKSAETAAKNLSKQKAEFDEVVNEGKKSN